MIFVRILGRFSLHVIAAIGLTRQPACAALNWEIMETRVQAAWGQKSATAVFPFRNDGKDTVRIFRVATSCSCTEALFVKDAWGAGEKGDLAVAIDLHAQMGDRQSLITITTDEVPQKTYELRVVTVVPEPITFSSRLAIWDGGVPMEPKAITIKLAKWANASVVGIEPTDGAFAARIEATQDPLVYRLIVLPRGASPATGAAIRLQTTIGADKMSFLIYAAVR